MANIDEYTSILSERCTLQHHVLKHYTHTIPAPPSESETEGMDDKLQEVVKRLELKPCGTPELLKSIATFHAMSGALKSRSTMDELVK